MIIRITISDQDSIDDIKAVGADDLLNCFLSKAGIEADKVEVFELTDENQRKRSRGEKYQQYEDIATK